MIHQLDKAVNVRLDIPSDYVIQSGNKVVVYYLEDDGTDETETTGNEGTGKDTENDGKGQSGSMSDYVLPIIIVVAVIIAIVAGVIVVKKKKA